VRGRWRRQPEQNSLDGDGDDVVVFELARRSSFSLISRTGRCFSNLRKGSMQQSSSQSNGIHVN
jgi:hypothetical protein